MNYYLGLADDFKQAVKAQVAVPSANAPAYQLARSAGFSERAVEMLEKAAIGSVISSTGPGDAMVSLSNGAKAWFQTLRTTSVFARLMSAGMMRPPLNTGFGIATSAPVAHIVGEGKPAPLTLFSASVDALTPVKALALLAVSDEVTRSSDQGSIDALDFELRNAVGAAVDVKFWSSIGAGVTGFSLGSSSGSFKADTQALLAAVNTTGAGSLVWALAPDVANQAAAYDLDMSPLGGEILGIPAVASSVLPSGTLRLVNASGVAGNLDDIEIGSSRNATVQMLDANLTQDATAGTGSATVSAFQAGFSLVRATCTFAAAKLKSNAAHEIVGVGSSWAA